MITVNKRLLKTTGTPNEIDALTILNKMTIYLCSFVYISLLYYILNIIFFSKELPFKLKVENNYS